MLNYDAWEFCRPNPHLHEIGGPIGDHLGNDDEPVTGQDGRMENNMVDRSFRGWNLRNFVEVYLISSYYFISIPHLFFIQYHSVVWEC